jgi:glycosyltransferase involved in cell wall biosynthesis
MEDAILKKHAYLIMAHNEFHMLKKLISQLDDPRNDIYIHIDKKARFVDEAQIASWAERSGVFFVKRRRIYWGTLSIVKCELELLAAAVKKDYAYYHLLSGTDMALKSADEIYKTFEGDGKEYVTCYPSGPDDDFLDKVKYRYPFLKIVGKGGFNGPGKKQKILKKIGYLQYRYLEFQKAHGLDRTKKYKDTVFYKGNQWFSITHALSCYVLSKKHEIIKMYRGTNCPDEIFLPTLIMNSPFAEKAAGRDLRKIDWKRGNPYEFKTEDLEELEASKSLFARKVSYDREPGLVNGMISHIKNEDSPAKKPKISIVVPCYNVEKYITECVDSLAGQTYPDTEIILVDDGSKDDTGKIADSLAAKYDNVICVHKTNGGLSSARNYGIERAKGEYIAFVDSDDWVEPDYTEKLYEAIVKAQADVAACGYRLEEASSGTVTFDEEGLLSPHEAMRKLGDIYPKENVLLVVAWNKLYKASLFKDLRYTENKIHEDEFIAHRVLGAADSVALIPDALYHYRIRENSITSAGNSQSIKRFDITDAFEDRIRYCRSMMYGDLVNIMLYTYFEGMKQLMAGFTDETIKRERLCPVFRKKAAGIYFRYFAGLDSYQRKDYLKLILFTRKYRSKVIELMERKNA